VGRPGEAEFGAGESIGGRGGIQDFLPGKRSAKGEKGKRKVPA